MTWSTRGQGPTRKLWSSDLWSVSWTNQDTAELSSVLMGRRLPPLDLSSWQRNTRGNFHLNYDEINLHYYIFRLWLFELWADKVKLLDGQDLLSALSSYYETAFCFQLKYPKEAQTVANIIQIRVAKYGDPTDGSLTNQRKDTAMNQITKYGYVVDN